MKTTQEVPWWKQCLLWCTRSFTHMLALGSIALTFAVCIVFLFINLLPSVDLFQENLASQHLRITDRFGRELYRLSGQSEERQYVPLESINPHIRHAFIAIEDERFFDRSCIDVRALMRAVYANIQNFKSQGASTITQQLIRNTLLGREKVFIRKLKEIALACQVEWQYEKEEILELYLNAAPFGNRATGIEQASLVYFGVPASDVTLAQAAILASLPQRPSYFNPHGQHRYTQIDHQLLYDIQTGIVQHSSDLKDDDPRVTIGLMGSHFGSGSLQIYLGGRSDQVLQNMEKLGFISEQERLDALQSMPEITFTSRHISFSAPHFVFWVRDEIESILPDQFSQPLTVETTLDWSMQQMAEDLVVSHAPYAQAYGAWNIALLAIDRQTREVLVHIGNVDYHDEVHAGQVDLVRASRQPGSSFKPFVYAAAFLKGYGPSTIVQDKEITLGSFTPKNYDGTFWGPLTIRQALAASRNIPAIIAYFMAGREDTILHLVSEMGVVAPSALRKTFREKNPYYNYGWSLALGVAETPLWQMVQGYSVLANRGIYRPVTIMRRTLNSKTDMPIAILQREPAKQVMPVHVAEQITSILQDVPQWSHEWLGVPGVDTSAKTGTSNVCGEYDSEGACILHLPRDVWVLGYSPRFITGVWIGNADGTPLHKDANGLYLAAPLWKEFMIRAHEQIEVNQVAF